MLPRSFRLPIALVAVVCLVRPLPAAGAPAPLPDWGVKGKPGSKPAEKPAETTKPTAPLPDWGEAGKPKSDKPKPKKKKSKSGKPTEPTEPTETEPEPTPPDETAPEPAAGDPTPAEATPAEPAPAGSVATPEGPAPEPAEPTASKPGTDTGGAVELRRRGRAELITGAVFMAGGLAGFGVLGAGLFIKGRADSELEDAEGRTDVDVDPLYAQQKQGETMLAAGAVVGVIGMALGIALVATGARDMKAGRAGLTSRVRVAPTFGGLVLSGRF